jgi:hypothetical protein
MMLKAVKFFNEYDPKRTAQLDMRAKAQRLMALYEDGERRLRANRERDLRHYRDVFRAYMDGGNFAVTPETQRSLRLE